MSVEQSRHSAEANNPGTLTASRAAFDLSGRVALITGSGRGIGLGIARALAAEGCALAIQDIDLDVAQAETRRIRDAGAMAEAFGGDVGDLDLPARLVAEVCRRLGGLHILINNAAIQKPYEDWTDTPTNEIERQVRADMISPMLFAKEAVKIFRRQKFGRIINLGSIQQRGSTDMLPYAMCKSALENMTRALAQAHARDGITVNQIAPGYFNTYRNREDFPDEQAVNQRGGWIPFGRVGQPEDCGGIALLLCSKAGEYITGQNIYVDGGLSVR